MRVDDFFTGDACAILARSPMCISAGRLKTVEFTVAVNVNALRLRSTCILVEVLMSDDTPGFEHHVGPLGACFLETLRIHWTSLQLLMHSSQQQYIIRTP